jgi:hypothetical protein
MRALPLFGDGRRSILTFDTFNPRARVLNPLEVEAPDVLKWIEAKAPRAIGSWDEIGAEEYARSFTVARSAGLDIIDDLYFAFYDTVASGGTEAKFAELVTPILKQKGWLKGDDGKIANRVQLIYDTNLRLARGSGRWQRYWSTRNALPYLRCVTARDERVRHPPRSQSDHRAFDGIILPIAHWFWSLYWPPFGFRCRCDVIQMTRSQLARLKTDVTTDAELQERIARIGPPVFASPSVPFRTGLEKIVEASNDSPMPGRPTIDLTAEIARGRVAWQAEAGAIALEELGTMLAKLFDVAA